MSVLLFSFAWVWRNLVLLCISSTYVSTMASLHRWWFIVCYLISDPFHRIFFWSLVQSFSLASRWPLCRCLVSLIEFFGFLSLLSLVGKLQILSIRLLVLTFILLFFWNSCALTHLYPSVLSVKAVVISAAFPSSFFFFTPFRFVSPIFVINKSLFRYRLLHCLGRSHSFQDFGRKINWLLFIYFHQPLYPQLSIHSFIHPSTHYTVVLGCLYISWGGHSHVLHLQLHRLFYSPF